VIGRDDLGGANQQFPVVLLDDHFLQAFLNVPPEEA
jgi:hypothetical protein